MGKRLWIKRIQKVKPRGRKFKYSIRQMRNFAYQAKSVKKQIKWLKKMYKQKEYLAKKHRFYGQVDMYRRLRRQAKETVLKYGIKKTTWKVASTMNDVYELAYKGVVSKDGTKLLVLDNDKNAILIAYEGDTTFNEALDRMRVVRED